MERNSEILRAVEGNDADDTTLLIGVSRVDGWGFTSSNRDDFTRLGVAIRNNTHIIKLSVVPNAVPSGVEEDEELYDGLKQNSSIHVLTLHECEIASAVCLKLLEVFQEKKNLSKLRIFGGNLQNGGEHILATTLGNCRNISHISLQGCNITDEQLLPMVEAIREHRKLKTLNLVDNNIGNVGCDAIATLLEDPYCSLHHISLTTNNIGNEGVIAIANIFANNKKLKSLFLLNNQFDESVVEDIFSGVLCNTSSINNTYASNHTLETLHLSFGVSGKLLFLLNLNKGRNKSHVAIRKILSYHPNIDMEPLFEWDADGEQTLKALPYIVDWFERAKDAVVDLRREGYRVEERKLSAIFQFTTSMPLLFVPTSQIKVDNKKRKRGETK